MKLIVAPQEIVISLPVSTYFNKTLYPYSEMVGLPKFGGKIF